MFESGAFYLYEPPPPPPNFASTIVLRRKGLDISGGDALLPDPATFAKVPEGGGQSARFYWQRAPQRRSRLVVREVLHGWRGSNYDIYVISESMPQEVFATRVRSEAVGSVSGSKWHPPLVLHSPQSDGLWLIDMNSQVLGDWPVRVMPDARQPACVVRFRPPAEDADDLLPVPIRRFISLVEATLGDGSDEGTLQQTTRRRVFLSHLWANAMRRPWVIADTPYNTRQEIDAGLLRWLLQAPVLAAVYEQLTAQYRIAETDLARHYQTTFGVSPEQSRAAAAFVMDVAFRSAYVFRTGERGRQTRRPNPWPSGVYGVR